MGRDISIAISARDNFTQAITTMKNANTSFKKDVEGLSSKLNTLNKTKITLKVDVDKARTELKTAEKQFVATGNAADKLKLELANSNYENARRNLSLVSDNARQAEKDIKSLTGAVSKSENRASSGGTSLINTLAAAGAAKMLGDTVSNIASSYIGSAFGSTGSTIFGNILSSAASGAAVGTMVGGPGLGTAIGGAAGTVLGAVNGMSQLYGEKDDAFKSTVQDLYNTAKESQSKSLTSGSGIAETREQMQISFATLLGGDSNAQRYLGQMTDFASRTPFEYDTLAQVSKTLLAYGYKQNELIPLLTKVGDAGSALGMNTEDMTFVATALGRMQTSGKTTLEYLNPLLERGIPVWDYLAQASGKTKAQVQEMVSKGLVPGQEAAKAIADYMGQNFAGNMDRQSKTFGGLTSTLTDAQKELDNAMGKGYIEERKKGLEAQNNYLGGESGAKLEEANKAIGAWKASLDNAYDEAIRTAQKKMMGSDEYQNAKAAGDYATMGKLMAQAQVQGMNEYKNSEGYLLQQEADLSLIKSIREDTKLKDSYWDTGYLFGKEFSKGRAAGMREISQSDLLGNMVIRDGGSYTDGYGNPIANANPSPSGHAYGLNYVPYNNFPALLHEGERVLTASEARTAGKGTNGVSVTVNGLTVREEADVEKVARVIVQEINKAFTLAG